MLIGIIGTKGSGKSTVASMLQYLLNSPYHASYVGWLRYNEKQSATNKELINAAVNNACIKDRTALVLSFAYPIKKMLSTLMEEPISLYESREAKEEPNLLRLCSSDGHIYSRRDLLKLVGTECFCNIIDKNTWVKHLISTYDKVRDCNVIVSDVRMVHEVAALDTKGAIFIYTNYNFMDLEDKHPSETSIDKCISYLHNHKNDPIDLNNGGLGREELFYRLKGKLNDIYNKYEERKSIKVN